MVLYVRFIETASKQISECDGAFENLPPASQTALLNVAFAGDYLGVPDLLAFSNRIKEYFKLNGTFMRMFNNWEGIDEELKTHCEAIKMQRVSPRELAQYYIEYMQRHALEPDPKVKNKLEAGEYSTNVSAGYGTQSLNNMFLCPAEMERRKMAELQNQLNHNAQQNGLPQMGGINNQFNPHNQGFGGQGGGFNHQNQFGNNQFQHQQAQPQFNNNQFGQPNQYNNQLNNHQFQQPQQPQFNNNQFGQPNQYNNNQFSIPTHQNTNTPQNNFFNNNPQQTHTPMNPAGNNAHKVNESNPFAQGLGHDDIFGNNNNQNQPKPGFGGPQQGGGGTGDAQFDDFLHQLNDLRDL